MSTARKKERSSDDSRISAELISAAFGAAKDGDLEEMRLLFSTSKMIQKDQIEKMINAKDKDGSSLLLGCIHGAAEGKNHLYNNTTRYYDCISFLMSLGMSADEKDNSGRSALHWCVLYGRLDFLDFLIRSGANLLVFDSSGLTCLHLAIGIRSERLRSKFVEYLCKVSPRELLEVQDGQKRSALFLAFSIKAVQIFEYLLASSADPNQFGPDGRQIIIHAIEKGQGKFTQILLKYGASLSTYDPDGFTAIHLAACQENPENILVLTDCVNKTLLNVKDRLGRTPLMYACLMGFDKNVQILLHQKIWILDKDNEGKTALHHTVNNTHCGCADLLCKDNKKIINMADNYGRTAGHDAVIVGNNIILKALLSNKCHPNAKDNKGHSMAHWLAAYGVLNCIECLLEYESLLDEEDNHGATPLHYACQKDDKNELTNARLQIIQVLLDNNARIATADKEGRKPIHWASSSGNVSAVELLLKYHVDINSITLQEKMSPLHLASYQGMLNMVSFLVNQKDILINLRDHAECTPLFYACTSGHVSVAEILLKVGADANLTDNNGESPCHNAATIGSIKCLELLLSANADLSCKNNNKDTPMHEAASAGQVDAILFLLNNGCQATVYNRTGATPLHYSVAEGKFDATKTLLEHEARVNELVVTNKNEYVTPLDIALANNDLNSIQLLQQYGARTGHSIADNASLIIQDGWKMYRRRVSGLESSMKSFISESVSTIARVINHDGVGCYGNTNDQHDGSKMDSIQRNSITPLEVVSKNDEIETFEQPDLKTTGAVCCQNNIMGKKTSSYQCEGDVESMPYNISNELSLSNAECERTNKLMDRISKLTKKIDIVVKDTEEISLSKEFDLINQLSERLKQRKENLKPLTTLPQLSASERPDQARKVKSVSKKRFVSEEKGVEGFILPKSLQTMNVEETLGRISKQNGVKKVIVLNENDLPIRSNTDNSSTMTYAKSCRPLETLARHAVRDLDPDNDLILGLQLLQQITYKLKIKQLLGEEENLIRYLVSKIISAESSFTLPCLGSLANICRSNANLQDYIKAMGNVIGFFRRLTEFLCHKDSMKIVYSLSILIIFVNEPIGEKVFNKRNMNQMFHMVFSFILKGNSEQEKKHSCNLLIDFIKCHQLQEYLAGYNDLHCYLKKVISILNTSDRESTEKILELFIKLSEVECLKHVAMKAIFSNDTTSANEKNFINSSTLSTIMNILEHKEENYHSKSIPLSLKLIRNLYEVI
eukprot:gene17414-19157_t